MKGKIFNTQEVQAIIAGNKTMFREVIKPCKQHPKSLCKKTRRAHYSIDFTENGLFWRPYGGSELQPFPYCDGKLSASNSLDEFCPYQVGQKIFVKERFARSFDSEGNPIAILEATSKQERKWRPAQHMKQEHSRITLEITDVKVERLQDISEDDCLDEGCYFAEVFLGDFSKPPRKIFNFSKKNLLKEDGLLDYKLAFKEYWDANRKKPEEKFKANPFVWVVDFKINK